MVKWLKKNKGFLAVLATLAVAYVLTRLINLTLIPIFTDEAIYIRWSQIGARDANWRFISLTDGKQPMFTWVMMIFLRVFKGDPLFVGRLVSVFSGFAGAIGTSLVAYELFKNRRTAVIAAFLYVISPFTLMYDRLALYDCMVAMFAVWYLYLTIRLVRTLRLDSALILAMVIGAAMLNKSSGFFGLYLLPFALILFDWGAPKRVSRLLRFVYLSVLVAVISEVYYSVLRLSPFFHIIGQKNTVFIYSFREWTTHPFTFAVGNLRGMFDWLMTYMTKPLFAAALLSVVPLFHRIREKLILIVYWAVPFVALALFGRVLYPRFILFMTIPLYVLAAYSLEILLTKYGRTYLGIFVFAVAVFPSLFTSYFVITDPWHALIPDSDKGQMLNDWPSGGGVKQVNEFLEKESRKGKLTVFTEGTFGLMPYSVEIYLVNNPNIEIRGIWPLPVKPPSDVIEAAERRPTYLILNQSSKAPAWPLELVAEYPKGTLPGRTLRLYKVIRSENPSQAIEGYL